MFWYCFMCVCVCVSASAACPCQHALFLVFVVLTKPAAEGGQRQLKDLETSPLICCLLPSTDAKFLNQPHPRNVPM